MSIELLIKKLCNNWQALLHLEEVVNKRGFLSDY